ncbi:hypothetical protein OCU04_009021 [Sclerotinia nivalis]|uniref:Uncharacterized protein n=1 Tax=Sclerotinia nivalis TaxID=352851 RepID=A0A9X0DGC2_9HELO|nr:hypothetical protein OCU04_009021 [Sclerotinia nivalis]
MDQNRKRSFGDHESSIDISRQAEISESQKKKRRELEFPLMSSNDENSLSSNDSDSYVPDSVEEYASLYHSLYNEKLACFGMIHAVRAKILDQAALGLPIGSIESFPFKTRFQEQCVFLDPSHGSHQDSQGGYAVLSHHTGRALSDIRKLGPIYFVFHLLVGDVPGISQTPREKDAYIMLDIIIFGSRDFGADISEILSSKRLYLQHPGPLKENIEYENPHFLKFEPSLSGVAEAAHAEFSNIDISTTPPSIAPTTIRSDDEAALQPRLQNEVKKILNSLTRSKSLKRIEADIRINTPLLR